MIQTKYKDYTIWYEKHSNTWHTLTKEDKKIVENSLYYLEQQIDKIEEKNSIVLNVLIDYDGFTVKTSTGIRDIYASFWLPNTEMYKEKIDCLKDALKQKYEYTTKLVEINRYIDDTIQHLKGESIQ
jgi:hypothetical protein